MVQIRDLGKDQDQIETLKHKLSVGNKSRKTAFQKVIDLVSKFAQPPPPLLRLQMANLKLAQNLCLCEPATKQTTGITTRNGM